MTKPQLGKTLSDKDKLCFLCPLPYCNQKHVLCPFCVTARPSSTSVIAVQLPLDLKGEITHVGTTLHHDRRDRTVH